MSSLHTVTWLHSVSTAAPHSAARVGAVDFSARISEFAESLRVSPQALHSNTRGCATAGCQRLCTGFAPAVHRLCTGCVTAVHRLFAGCAPAVHRLCNGHTPRVLRSVMAPVGRQQRAVRSRGGRATYHGARRCNASQRNATAAPHGWCRALQVRWQLSSLAALQPLLGAAKADKVLGHYTTRGPPGPLCSPMTTLF
jgi:hypothetical protein